MRAIASMLNTRGGFLFIGVDDYGIVQGIHDENYDDHDDAMKTLEQHIINYLGSHQEKFVDIKIITDLDGKEVMVAKIDRCDIPTHMQYFDMDETGGR